MVLIQHLKPKIIETVRKLIVEDEKLRTFMFIWNAEINKSLDPETYDDTTVKSIITYVNKLPTVKAEGTFLSMEFASNKISFLIMRMSNNSCDLQVQPILIPEKYMVGKSEKLLDFIAKSLSEFLRALKVNEQRIPLGIIFGFPSEQISLQECKLTEWSNGFHCNDLIGENIFTKLNDSFRKYKNLKNVYIIGIVNQTTSMLLAAFLQAPEVTIAVNIGEEFGCCYMEKVSRVKKYEPKSYAEKFMCINLNTNNFGEDDCLNEFKTDFDIQLDQESTKPGQKTFKKMTSTTYIGEIARLALVRCIQSKAILNGELTEKILQRYSFNFHHMLRIESDAENNHENCMTVLKEFGYNAVTDEDCVQVQFVCRCVSRRAAHLFGAQLAVLINRINNKKMTIVVKGDVLENYPRFKEYMLRKMKKLKMEKISVHILNLKNTSLIRGGGVLALTFGEEVMNREEKLRRLPGFPVNRCHFRRTGRCLNPNCGANHPCDTSKVNPIQNPIRPEARDFEPDCFDQKHCPKKGDCTGYDKLSV